MLDIKLGFQYKIMFHLFSVTLKVIKILLLFYSLIRQSLYGFSCTFCHFIFVCPCPSHLSITCPCLLWYLLFISICPPLPLSLRLQPSRRPSLQTTFSQDCLSTPPPHHHCHDSQRFASQLSLCLGNPHPSSPCTSSHLPAPPLCSSPVHFPHHVSSSPNSQLQSLPLQNSLFYNRSFSPHHTRLNPESKAHPSSSLQCRTNLCSPPHTDSDSRSSASCLHKINAPPSSHLFCPSQPASNSSHCHPSRLFPFLSQSSPDLNSLSSRTSNVCPLTLQNIQPESNSNLKIPLLPSFHPGCQSNPSSPLQPDSDPQAQRCMVQPCGRPPLVSPPPLPPYTLPSANAHPPSQIPSHHPPFPLSTCRPLKAGGVLLHCAKAVFNH